MKIISETLHSVGRLGDIIILLHIASNINNLFFLV